jgi:hypothetical protein
MLEIRARRRAWDYGAVSTEDEIAAWLRAQAEADLEAAQKATPGPWEFEGDVPDVGDLYSAHDENLRTVARTRDRQVANGQHMERHDPLTEKARAESVLAVLDEHARLNDSIWCRTCDPAGESGDSAAWYPCRTVRLLACGYRHREGFKEAWKP